MACMPVPSPGSLCLASHVHTKVHLYKRAQMCQLTKRSVLCYKHKQRYSKKTISTRCQTLNDGVVRDSLPDCQAVHRQLALDSRIQYLRCVLLTNLRPGEALGLPGLSTLPQHSAFQRKPRLGSLTATDGSRWVFRWHLQKPPLLLLLQLGPCMLVCAASSAASDRPCCSTWLSCSLHTHRQAL